MPAASQQGTVVFISDIHYGGPWLSKECEVYVASFLTELAQRADVEKVVMLGDVLEEELHPFNQTPPTIPQLVCEETIPQSPFLSAWRELSRLKPVIVIVGNHDSALFNHPNIAAHIEKTIGCTVYQGPSHDQDEAFLICDPSTSKPLIAASHGFFMDSLCLEPLIVSKSTQSPPFHRSLGYLIGRIAAANLAAASMTTPQPTTVVIKGIAHQLGRDWFMHTAAAAHEIASSPLSTPINSVVNLVVGILEVFIKSYHASDETVIDCGDGFSCTCGDVLEIGRHSMQQVFGSSAELAEMCNKIDEAVRSDDYQAGLSRFCQFVDVVYGSEMTNIVRAMVKKTGGDTPVVIFGHTHMAELRVVDGSCVYANTGAMCNSQTVPVFVEVKLGTSVSLFSSGKLQATLPWP